MLGGPLSWMMQLFMCKTFTGKLSSYITSMLVWKTLNDYTNDWLKLHPSSSH